MRLAEGPRTGNATFVKKPGKRMNHRGFQRLNWRQWRQNTGHACCQHRFTRTGRANHEKMMPPSRRNLKRAFCAFLAFDIAQVLAKARKGDLAGLCGVDHVLSGKVPHHVQQCVGRRHFGCADPGCFRPAGFRA